MTDQLISKIVDRVTDSNPLSHAEAIRMLANAPQLFERVRTYVVRCEGYSFYSGDEIRNLWDERIEPHFMEVAQ
ncbi:MAG: hypothetical protein GC179_30680 [Anaerolineaceae bacterium]|nr:hypothetical protein [Anaerolineaceae bacterium]